MGDGGRRRERNEAKSKYLRQTAAIAVKTKTSSCQPLAANGSQFRQHTRGKTSAIAIISKIKISSCQANGPIQIAQQPKKFSLKSNTYQFQDGNAVLVKATQKRGTKLETRTAPNSESQSIIKVKDSDRRAHKT